VIVAHFLGNPVLQFIAKMKDAIIMDVEIVTISVT